MKAFKEIAQTTAGYFAVFSVMFTSLTLFVMVSVDIASGVLV